MMIRLKLQIFPCSYMAEFKELISIAWQTVIIKEFYFLYLESNHVIWENQQNSPRIAREVLTL